MGPLFGEDLGGLFLKFIFLFLIFILFLFILRFDFIVEDFFLFRISSIILTISIFIGFIPLII